MATFPSIKPTYSLSKSSEPQFKVSRFGDGYEHRISWGLHQNPKQWSLSFNVSDTNADTIEAFLDARAEDAASFDWTPPNEVTAYKWVCQSWERELIGPNRSVISCTFRQVFEP